MTRIAALFVESGGVYAGVPLADLWSADVDARNYTGPFPVVAHPPCKRWGRFWHGSTAKPHQFRLGEDAGCFAAAMTSVRNYGGVLEHPAHSHAFRWFGLPIPKQGKGWTPLDAFGGASCYVEQGHYGHMSRKPTWLYACHTDLPALNWTKSPQRIHPKALEMHGYEKARRMGMVAMIGGKDKEKIRDRTPDKFRDVLVAIAVTARAPAGGLQ